MSIYSSVSSQQAPEVTSAEIESKLDVLASVYSSVTIKTLTEHVKNVIDKVTLIIVWIF